MGNPNIENTSTPNTPVVILPNNKPSNKPKSEIENQMDLLLNGSGDKGAILMSVLATIVGKENILMHKNAILKAEATTIQTEAAKEQGVSAMQGAISEAVNEGVGGAMGLASAGYGIKSVANNRQLKAKFDKDINDANNNIRKFDTSNSIKPQEVPKNFKGTREQYIAKLKQDVSHLENDRKNEVKLHSKTSEHIGQISQVTTGISKMGSSVAQGQSQASTSAARNTAELAGQAVDAIKGNLDTDKGVAEAAMRLNIGAARVAEARG